MSGYARNCSACGTQISCNMYGMGHCQFCGFDDKAIQDDNEQRAADWRREKGLRYVRGGQSSTSLMRGEVYQEVLDLLRGEQLYRDLDLSVGQDKLVKEVADYIERRLNDGSL